MSRVEVCEQNTCLEKLTYIALWIVTAIFAAAFAMAGTMKVIKPYTDVRAQMDWVEVLTPAQLKGIGIVEVLGALGMVLPAATGILPWLTPVAAFGLFATMIVALVLHLRRKEAFLPSLILGLIALSVGIGWLVIA